MAACSKYVASALGKEFVEPTPWTLEDVFPDTSSRVPTVFILSPGQHCMCRTKNTCKFQHMEPALCCTQ